MPDVYFPIYQWQGRLAILSRSLIVFLLFRKAIWLNIYLYLKKINKSIRKYLQGTLSRWNEYICWFGGGGVSFFE